MWIRETNPTTQQPVFRMSTPCIYFNFVLVCKSPFIELLIVNAFDNCSSFFQDRRRARSTIVRLTA